MRILLATDGSEYALEAAAQCGELVSGIKDAVVKIITVADYTIDFDSDAFLSEEEFIALVERETQIRAEKVLAEAEKIVGFENDHIKIETDIFIGSAKKFIVEEAKDWGADLIIVGSHGYGFLTRALIGSVSDAVVHHAPCSVLVVRKSE
jgi:nucleotide-binding universal stress UspA family protein